MNNPLTANGNAGWYDYTQRTPGGNGAHFVTDSTGHITGIEITYTDNAFGDENPRENTITDPLVPVKNTDLDFGFTELKYDVFANNQNFVKQLYQDILFRGAEDAGTLFWQNLLDNGKLSRADLALNFLHSKEFSSGVESVTRLYMAALGHIPEEETLETTMWNSHSAPNLGNIAASLISNAEFINKYGANTSNTAFVDALYKNVLNRAAEASGVAYWNNILDRGSSRADVLVQFSQSVENTIDNAATTRIAADYIGIFDRDPEPAGLKFWQDVYKSGVPEIQIVGDFLKSPEYLAMFSGNLT